MATSDGSNTVLVLIKGHPGVGKSTLARSVCQHLGWPLIDKDDARDCLQRLPAAVLQSFDANQLSYDIMFSYCRTQLQLGLSTALDCPFARLALYQKAADLASEHGATIAVVECVVGDTAVWRQQLEARSAAGAEPQAHKPQTWEQLQELLERYGESHKWTSDGSCSLQHHLVVDTTGCSLQQQVQQVVAFLAAISPAAAPPGTTSDLCHEPDTSNAVKTLACRMDHFKRPPFCPIPLSSPSKGQPGHIPAEGLIAPSFNISACAEGLVLKQCILRVGQWTGVESVTHKIPQLIQMGSTRQTEMI